MFLIMLWWCIFRAAMLEGTLLFFEVIMILIYFLLRKYGHKKTPFILFKLIFWDEFRADCNYKSSWAGADYFIASLSLFVTS